MTAHVRALLSDYLDGELNDEAARQVEAHLTGCEVCANDHHALRRTVRFIQGNGAIDVPPDSPWRSVERFDRVVMDPSATEADRATLMTELARRIGLLPGDGRL